MTTDTQTAALQKLDVANILNQMSQGLLLVSCEGMITACNPAAETFLGFTSQQILHKPFATQFSDNFFGFSIEQALSRKKPPAKSFAVITSAEGTRRELEVDITWVTQKGIIILIRDVTEMHQLQELAHRHTRLEALGELSTVIAHQLRNPLGSIKGFASLLARDLEGQPASHRMACDIMTATDSLNKMVSNILNYARPLQLQVVASDLIALARDLCRQMEVDNNLDPRTRIVFHSSLPDLLIPVDKTLIQSAVLNVLTNAVQAMPEGGTITISIEKKETHAHLEITDTGIGISPENLKKLFVPFFTTKQDGNGFGLAETRRVIRAHGGSIDVRSVVGKGTTFAIKLPFVGG